MKAEPALPQSRYQNRYLPLVLVAGVRRGHAHAGDLKNGGRSLKVPAQLAVALPLEGHIQHTLDRVEGEGALRWKDEPAVSHGDGGLFDFEGQTGAGEVYFEGFERVEDVCGSHASMDGGSAL